MIKFFGFFVLLGIFSGICGGDKDNRTGDSGQRFYGEKIKFWQNQPVKFESFDLIFIGKRTVIGDMPRQANGDFPSRTYIYYDFKVKTEKQEKSVTWSLGTGDIAPTVFEVGGRKYELELRRSDKLGKLAEDELVVWEKQ